MRRRLSRRAFVRCLAVLVVGHAATNPATAQAQDYPAKPVRVIVANSIGSLADVVARVIFTKAGELLGQPFVIDNRPGAGGMIAGEGAAKSPPDGYTLILASDSVMTISPHMYKAVPYDALRDFAPITLLTKVPTAFVAHPSLGVKSLEDFLRLARERPGTITYGSGGTGHATHMGMEMLILRANIQLVHVPYKGTGPATQAVIANEVSAASMGLGLVQSQIQDGRLVGLAISGPRAEGTLPQLPDVEKVVPGSGFVSWQGAFAPAKTPQPVIDRLHATLLRAVAIPEVRARLLDTGNAIVTTSPVEFGKMLAEDSAKNRELVQRMGLKGN